eukprot:scaffold45954_cov62-Phaeocystis_antarctica.AAC.8
MSRTAASSNAARAHGLNETEMALGTARLRLLARLSTLLLRAASSARSVSISACSRVSRLGIAHYTTRTLHGSAMRGPSQPYYYLLLLHPGLRQLGLEIEEQRLGRAEVVAAAHHAHAHEGAALDRRLVELHEAHLVRVRVRARLRVRLRLRARQHDAARRRLHLSEPRGALAAGVGADDDVTLEALTKLLLQQPCRPAALLPRADDEQPPLARYARHAPLQNSPAAQTKLLHPAAAALELTAWLERLEPWARAAGFLPVGRTPLEGDGAPSVHTLACHAPTPPTHPCPPGSHLQTQTPRQVAESRGHTGARLPCRSARPSAHRSSVTARCPARASGGAPGLPPRPTACSAAWTRGRCAQAARPPPSMHIGVQPRWRGLQQHVGRPLSTWLT